jgi:hypothetical protein
MFSYFLSSSSRCMHLHTSQPWLVYFLCLSFDFLLSLLLYLFPRFIIFLSGDFHIPGIATTGRSEYVIYNVSPCFFSCSRVSFWIMFTLSVCSFFSTPLSKLFYCHAFGILLFHFHLSVLCVHHSSSIIYKHVLYMQWVTFWRYEVVNKHFTESSNKATPPIFRYNRHSQERLNCIWRCNTPRLFLIRPTTVPRRWSCHWIWVIPPRIRLGICSMLVPSTTWRALSNGIISSFYSSNFIFWAQRWRYR